MTYDSCLLSKFVDKFLGFLGIRDCKWSLCKDGSSKGLCVQQGGGKRTITLSDDNEWIDKRIGVLHHWIIPIPPNPQINSRQFIYSYGYIP